MLLRKFLMLTVALVTLGFDPVFYQDGARAKSGSIAARGSLDDRHSVPVLRHQYNDKPSSLSDEEIAVLQAASRTGFIQFPDCRRPSNNLKLIGNAFLVRANGRDAIMTSGHLILDPKTDAIRYDCTPDQFRRIVYYPDISYIDLKGAEEPEDGDPGTIGVALDDTEQFNLEELAHNKPNLDFRNDWVIFTLPNPISEEQTPDGNVRGYFKMASRQFVEGEVYDGFLIGFDPYIDSENGGPASTYQKCTFEIVDGRLKHRCYTTLGSSSAVVGTMENGEIKLVGMHNQDVSDPEASSKGDSRSGDAVFGHYIEATQDIQFAR
ncbi:hypothetical protein [uncultured Nitratireductor sp.]|uniref:hypothetical protein n=1 Tax=uncultured Nitratireductor sp. TaxID=520953 RepID=UPI0025E4762C|nr:hypothetical protein [uncultured Nitratireductor sp.]